MQNRIGRLIDLLSQDLLEKREPIALGILALCAGESLFLLGPPGVAKSLVARRLKAAFYQAQSFEYLMGRFSTPEELFGPLSIAGLRDRDVFERHTEGYLPQADIVFLDEIWRASPPIQNALLSILNEKLFRNGACEMSVPLKLLIGASNHLPVQEENSEAFWDRFLLRWEVSPIQDLTNFMQLLQGSRDLYHPVIPPDDQIKPQEWLDFHSAIDAVKISQSCLSAFKALKEKIASVGYVSDRRWKKTAYLVRTVAFLHGREMTDPMDMGILEHVLWHDLSQKKPISELVHEVIEDYGWDCNPSFEEVQTTAHRLKEGLKSLTLCPQQITMPIPVLYDGEYYVLVDYPGSLQARVWAQDFQLLQQEEWKGEIFFFQPTGLFIKSEPHFLRASEDPMSLYVDGQYFTLAYRQEERTVWERRPLEKDSLQEWEGQIVHFISELKGSSKGISQYAEDKKQEGQKHLFSSGYVKACSANLSQKADLIDQMIVQMEYLLETKIVEE